MSSKRLQEIVGKLERLQVKVQALRQEKEELQAVNKDLRERLRSWQNAQQKADQHISEHAPGETEKQRKGVRAATDQDIRQQIDHYLSEIDKCIEWLGQQ